MSVEMRDVAAGLWLWRLIIAVAVIGGICADVARAEGPSIVLKSRFSTSLLSDGDRYAVWTEGHGRRLRVVDAQAHVTRLLTVPAGCLPATSYRDSLDEISGDTLLLTCPGAPSQLLDLVTGQTVVRPADEPGWGEIGTYWLRADTDYVNRVTGEQRSSRTAMDLNSPDFRPQAFCRPFSPAAGDGLLGRGWRDQMGQWAISVHGNHGGPALVGGRCGAPRTFLAATFGMASLSAAGLVTWTSMPGRILGYDLARHRCFAWRFPRGRFRPDGFAVTTRAAAYIADVVKVNGYDGAPTGMRVYEVRHPFTAPRPAAHGLWRPACR